MSTNAKKVIAVVGASGHQGGSVVSALQASGEFKVRALTRKPAEYKGTVDEVVEGDLNRPETLKSAFAGAHGVFAVTNFWEPGGTDEIAQGKAAVEAAKQAGVQHFVWSTLPNVEEISGGKFAVPHFTDKATVDAEVTAAGFKHHTFVIAPFYFQNLLTSVAAQQQQDGSKGWTLPIDPAVRAVHMGDIGELGSIVAGAFAHPDLTGNGEYLPLVGSFLSFNELVATLNSNGGSYTFNQVPANVFANFFPGAGELAEMLGYFEKHTYLGVNSDERIALAKKVAGKETTDFRTWALTNMPSV